MREKIGIFGLVVGLLAVGIAIFQDDLRPAKAITEPAPEPTLKELAIEKGRTVINEKIFKKEESAPAVEEGATAPRDGVKLTYMLLGFVAMVLGIVSWVTKEHIRVSGAAVSLGLVAVAWQYVLIGIVIAVVILILANLSV